MKVLLPCPICRLETFKILRDGVFVRDCIRRHATTTPKNVRVMQLVELGVSRPVIADVVGISLAHTSVIKNRAKHTASQEAA